MSRIKNVIPAVEKKIQLATDVCARMELELYSEVEGKIPYGAQSELINRLLREHFKRLDALDNVTFSTDITGALAATL